MPPVDAIAKGVLAGNFRAAGQAISAIENEATRVDELVRLLFAHTGRAYTVGFTGPPGAGKSCLVDDIVQFVRTPAAGAESQSDIRVGIIAVDPNSPFSGGAILGDRIRMMRHTVDPHVFIRSMGSRGHLGGLAIASARAVEVFDALGMDYVLLETVGVGQSELEVAEQADTTVVVVMPGLGDSVQTIKAGIMEIADVFVVNKADHAAVQKTMADLKELMRMDAKLRAWIPPIVKTVATREEGIADLWDAILKHRHFLESTGQLATRRRKRLERQIVNTAADRLRERVLQPSSRSPEFQSALDDVVARRLDPLSAAELLIGRDGQAAIHYEASEASA